MPKWKTSHRVFEENGQTLRRLHQLLRRQMQNRFSSSAERLREANRQRLQRLRLANSASLDERKTPLEPVPQSRMSGENQGGKALNWRYIFHDSVFGLGFAEALGGRNQRRKRENANSLETTATALIAVPLRVLFSPVHIAFNP